MAMTATLSDAEVRTVRLYGPMRARFGRDFRLAVTSTQDAIRALSALIPGFREFMVQAAANRQEFACLHGTRRIGEERLGEWLDPDEPIRIAMVVRGNKRGGLFQIVLGAVLIGAAWWAAGTFAGAFAAKGLVGAAAWMGASLVLNGAAQALGPQPPGLSTRDDVENRPSYAFNGPVNVAAQGNPVPVAYSDPDGFVWMGSAVVSQGIFSEDQQ
jgi:predicted phage tail protein